MSDHIKNINVNDLMCCGVKEISGIQGTKPKDVIMDVGHRLFSEKFENRSSCAFIVFTDTDSKEDGKKLAKTITELKLGKTTRTSAKRNPNSENSLAAWIWELHLTNLKKYYKQNEEEYVRSNY